MTIRYENIETGSKRLAEYRAFEDKTNPDNYRGFGAVSPITIYESMAEPGYGENEMVLAKVTDPDTIEIRRVHTGPFGQIPTFETVGTITREAINFANLTDGSIKAVWEKTKPGDYPPPPEGYTLIENPQ